MERSADFLDSASQLTDVERNSKVAAISAAAKRGDGSLKPRGSCYYCTAEIPKPKIYCDADCADDHATLLESRRRLGR